MSGIYIHIPFCKSRCIYCGFYSTTQLAREEEYVDAVCHELDQTDWKYRNIRTIYFGGGTPSQMPVASLESILSVLYGMYEVAEDAEITLEGNPDDMTLKYLRGLSSIGVNRLSMGVQSFDNQRLTFLRRRHTAKQAKSAFTILRKAGFENISIDLMFGFPNQSVADWQSDLNEALSLRPEHISAYSLMIEENTPLWRMYQSGKVETRGI